MDVKIDEDKILIRNQNIKAFRLLFNLIDKYYYPTKVKHFKEDNAKLSAGDFLKAWKALAAFFRRRMFSRQWKYEQVYFVMKME